MVESTIADRIREAIDDSGQSQSAIARAIGVTPQAITKAMKFGHLAKHHVGNFCRFTGVNEAWLLEGVPPKIRQPGAASEGRAVDQARRGSDRELNEDDPVSTEFVGVRRLKIKISAGVTGYTVDYEIKDEPPIFFREDWVASRRLSADDLVGLKVSGASMEPGLYDGDSVVINTRDIEPRDGEVFAVNYEGELVIKRLKRDGGDWWLASDNTDKRRYPDKRVSEGVILLGRVVHKSSERI